MTILVTGAEGFLGRSVVARLAQGYSVIAVDRIPHQGPALPGVIYHQADLSDASALLPPAAGDSHPFVLVHLAWDMRRHQGFTLQAEQIRQMAALLDYWGDKGLGKVMAMGSAEEYGSRAGKLAEGDSPVSPLSPYGWAKRSARDLLRAWADRARISALWLRPFVIYGPGQQGDMLIPFALQAAKLRQVAQFTDGRQRRDFVHVDDVAGAILAAAGKELAGFTEVNLGRGEEVQVADVLMTIARHYDAESLFHLGARPRRPGEPDVQVADTSTAWETLGWKAAISWQDGLKTLF